MRREAADSTSLEDKEAKMGLGKNPHRHELLMVHLGFDGSAVDSVVACDRAGG